MKDFFVRLLPGKLIFFLGLIMLSYITLNRNWLNSKWPIQMDANGYYIYLPAIFIYGDLERLSFVDKMPEQFDRKYFLYKGAAGGYMTKYTPGMALLEFPFFAAGHQAAKLFGFPCDGYSPPYRLAIAVSSLFFSLLGLYLLSVFLRRYFPVWIVNTCLVLLFFGTNLFFNTVIQAGVTHNYLFFVFSGMILCLDNWRRSAKIRDFALACACVGFSALIRPTEVIIGIVPLVYFLFIRGFSLSGDWFRRNLPSISTGLTCFILMLVPVFIYWKYATGNWVAYTYEDEGFYFDRPWQIWYGLFGFRKGWFVYTPLAAIALFSAIRYRGTEGENNLTRAFLMYLPLHIFIALSWYGWWYGGCFGNRAFVPVLAFLALPLAVLIQKSSSGKIGLLIVVSSCVALNLFQTFQYQRQVLHMDSMTWPAYRYVFGKWKLSEEEKKHLKTLLEPADYSQRGKKLDAYFR